MNIVDSVKTIKAIGEKTAKALEKLGVYTVGDLLCHYPSRYIKYEAPVFIGTIRTEGICAIEGMFAEMPITKASAKTIVTCRFADPTGNVETIWFNQPYIAKTIRRGTHDVLRGKGVKKGSRYSMQQPVIYYPQDYRRLMDTL